MKFITHVSVLPHPHRSLECTFILHLDWRALNTHHQELQLTDEDPTVFRDRTAEADVRVFFRPSDTHPFRTSKQQRTRSDYPEQMLGHS